MKGVHALLSGPDAVEVARVLRHSADQILSHQCDCSNYRKISPEAWLRGEYHEDGCLGVRESGEIIKIVLKIETQLMRKAKWLARRTR